jgi:diguanylate cyclase (GGDEF)-like protein
VDALYDVLRDPERLRLVGRARSVVPALRATFEDWADTARRTLGASVALVSLADECDRHVVGAAGVPPSPHPIPVAESACRPVIRHGSVFATGDVRRHPELAGGCPEQEPGVVAYAGAPIVVEGQTLGSLCVAGAEPRTWTPGDLQQLRHLARAIATALTLRLTVDELERSAELVATHDQVHAAIAAGSPGPVVLEDIVAGVERYDPALRGSALLLDADRGTLHHAAGRGLPDAYLQAIDGPPVGPLSGSCGTAAHLGEEVVTGDVQTDPRWIGYRELAKEHGLRHCWSFPLIGSSGAVLGTLAFYGDAPRRPDERQLGLLRGAARLAGIAVEADAMRDRLVHSATHDALTGLPNRAALIERLEEALARSSRTGRPVTVLAIDIDRLRLINDTLGLEVGDEVLRRVARALAERVRPGDTVARTTGDEFVVIAEDTDAEQGRDLTDRLLGALERPVLDGEHATFQVTVSIGAVVAQGRRDTAGDAVGRAQAAMHEVRSAGGNGGAHHAAHRARATERRLLIEAALRDGRSREQFRVVAQPVVALEDGSLQCVEALLRWNHPELGQIGPAEFIPIAEDTGLIVDIGTWVLEQATAHGAVLNAALPSRCRIAVNVSPHQVRDPGFAQAVEYALGRSGLAPELLVLEITETALLTADDTTRQMLEAISDVGVHVALDDFGTGHSSVVALKRHPIDTIKIDRAFVRDLPGSEDDRTIVSALVALGQGLGCTVVAEGVETVEQLACVRELGCERVQGYLFGRPMSFEDVPSSQPDDHAA